MKTFLGLIIILISTFLIPSCIGKGDAKREQEALADSLAAPDSIVKYFSRQLLVKEVTFKDGVRNGLMKSFYQDGRLRMTFWYENDLREDSSMWYYQEGQLFRSTPYKRDTIEGTQIQYYRNGRIKAKLSYVKGLRTTYLEEFTSEGKLVGGYPELLVNVRDDYQTRGLYKISLELSDKSTKVKYFRGDLSNGLYDTAHIYQIETIEGKGTMNLKKTGSPKADNVGIIAEILTNFGNKYLVYKKIDLPYKDLN